MELRENESKEAGKKRKSEIFNDCIAELNDLPAADENTDHISRDAAVDRFEKFRESCDEADDDEAVEVFTKCIEDILEYRSKT